MIFAVEAWDPDYGTGGDIDALDPSTDIVSADVEIALDNWEPLTPVGDAVQGVIYFVDGVRRIDARIWVTDGGQVLPGSCATVAAGAVACTATSAIVSEIHVRRALFVPPTQVAASIATDIGLYEHRPVKSGSPEDLYLAIHEEMTHLETTIVPEAGPEDLIVFDGPLRGRRTPRAIGFIKTQHVQYLEDVQQRVVMTLEAGQRSPIFRIGAARFARWSFYLRLPGPLTHGWAGIVRCEIAADTHRDIQGATRIADMICLSLPRFASEPHKDSRAPQNLYPISGLERTLRRRLGDQRLLQRALRRAAAES